MTGTRPHRTGMDVVSLFLDGGLCSELFCGELLGGGQCVRGGNFDVRLNAGAFPVGVRDGIYGARERHSNPEMLGDAVSVHRVSASPGGLADDGGALEILQVIAELFRARKSVLGSQN